MKDTIRVFVNAGPLDLPSGADVAQAVRLFDPALARQIAGGTAYVTDGRGIEIDSTSPLMAGAILRVVVRARRSESGHADA
jgi:hypothetical protein